MFQFSLRNLLIAVAFCAFGAAALVNANSWWVAISWSAALFSLAAAAVLTLHRRAEKRPFSAGYLIFGSLYVFLLMYSIQPTSSSNSSILCLQSLSYFNLLTTKLTTWSYTWLPASLTTEYLNVPSPGSSGPMGSSGGSMGPGMPMGGGSPLGMPGMPGMSGPGAGMMPGAAGPVIPITPNPRYVDQTTYTEVSHALWTILIAFLGGALSGWICATRQPEREPH